jgi:hypothetical protein
MNEAVKLLSDLEKSSNASLTDASQIAMIYASMRDNEQAMNWLERAYEERFNPSILLRSGFGPLRSDPRFEDLLRRVGLPSWTGEFGDGDKKEYVHLLCIRPSPPRHHILSQGRVSELQNARSKTGDE